MDLVAGLEAWPGAALIRQSGTAYLFVNAAHILGIGLLVGAILPLDLRLLGCFRAVPLAVIGAFLTRAAAVGLALALSTGFWLFTVKPAEYLANEAFLWKLGLLAFAITNIGLQHGGGFRAAMARGEVSGAIRLRAAISVTLWLGTLLAGRWIGFL
ncbi:membrane protein [Bosea sp. WAO]|uniref:hypothetical protein n=1 Tax=Bosea sp. WAO TaxID=406341 RepID=UPI000747DBD9|nr:hypothetical protein [Bosea sp. WAO]KUL96223.1 membrane protein [Bosea sp. WAO]